jgi:hypothetical protein
VSLNSYVAPRRVPVAGLLGVVGALAVLAVVAGVAWNAVRGDGGPVLPDTFAGRARIASDQDFGQDGTWQAAAADAAGGAGIAGAAYGAGTEGRLNVTAARADLAGKLDLTFAADAGEAYGDVRCTRNLNLAGTVTSDPGRLLCWHTSAERSVVVLAIGHAPAPEELAANVDRLWLGLG